MKPKHRIFCRECGKSKIVFESEKKALNFIKFNSNDIATESDIVPNRAYYCVACGGYHVTHCRKNYKPYTTEEIIEAYKRDKQNNITNN